MMMHIQPSKLGDAPNVLEDADLPTHPPDNTVHHQFRTFVVVREVSDELFCYCW